MKNEKLFIKQITVGPMMNFTYLVGNKDAKKAVIIDPGWEGSKIVDEAKKEGFEIAAILATHSHFDHINDVQHLVDKLGVPVYVHQSETNSFKKLADVRGFADNEIIDIGNMTFQTIHTPGHTKGSSCFLIDNALFTGDTLFIDNIGRTDLEDGNVGEMFASLSKLRELPDNIIIYPGHNYGKFPAATMGEQKKTNPYLKCASISDFFRIA